jgi:hypothetical protein
MLANSCLRVAARTSLRCRTPIPSVTTASMLQSRLLFPVPRSNLNSDQLRFAVSLAAEVISSIADY